jgi:HEAT repeat protein
MLRVETDQRVLESVIIAFGHFKVNDSTPLLIVYKDSPDSDTRQRLAWCLGGYEHELAIDTLLILMEDDDVRDWANFGIGSQSDVDTPQIRDALFKLIDDEHNGVSYEALNGLCRRNDPRGIKRLIKIIETKEADEWFLNIAAESKSKEILSALVEIDKEDLIELGIRSAWEYAVGECGGN